MTKKEALDAFGCENYLQLADVLGVSSAAISQWTDPLPPHAVMRVESALYRKNGGRKYGKRR